MFRVEFDVCETGIGHKAAINSLFYLIKSFKSGLNAMVLLRNILVDKRQHIHPFSNNPKPSLPILTL